MEDSQEVSETITILSLLTDDNFVSTNSLELEETCESDSSIIIQVQVENCHGDNDVCDESEAIGTVNVGDVSEAISTVNVSEVYSEVVPVMIRVQGSRREEPVSDSRTEEPVSIDEDDQVMDHEFLYRKVFGKSGKNVGKVFRMVSLFIGPYKFRKRNERANGVVQFTCTSCENIHSVVVSAFGGQTTDEDGNINYNLDSYPSHSEHVCIRNGFENYKERGVMKMYQMVQEDQEINVQCLPTSHSL